MSLLTVLLLAGILPASVTACEYVGLSVTKAGKAARPLESSAFDVATVRNHFDQKAYVTYAGNTNTTFSCVDARAEGLKLGTPGGDLAELSNGMYIFFNLTGIQPNARGVDFIFRQFMSTVASPKRPFYFHTDDAKLAGLSAAVAKQTGVPQPVKLPSVQPANQSQAEVWYSQLARAEHQGCGHIRLMLVKYKDYGLSSPLVPEQLIKSFFKYWWPTPLGSEQRSKVDFIVKPGPLAGRAVAIISNAGPACTDSTPLTQANNAGSSIFVYHVKAVADFRRKVLAPFFESISRDAFWGGPVKFDEAAFVKEINQLANKQLGFTLGNLSPANSVNQFAVTYTTESKGSSSKMGQTSSHRQTAAQQYKRP